jgi:hypothetical protein
MEMSQRNSMYSYLKQTKKINFFLTRLENRRVEQVLSGIGISGRGRGSEKCMGGG